MWVLPCEPRIALRRLGATADQLPRRWRVLAPSAAGSSWPSFIRCTAPFVPGSGLREYLKPWRDLHRTCAARYRPAAQLRRACVPASGWLSHPVPGKTRVSNSGSFSYEQVVPSISIKLPASRQCTSTSSLLLQKRKAGNVVTNQARPHFPQFLRHQDGCDGGSGISPVAPAVPIVPACGHLTEVSMGGGTADAAVLPSGRLNKSRIGQPCLKQFNPDLAMIIQICMLWRRHV